VATPEEKQDELVTRASAQTITWFRQNLKREIKTALKEIYWELWTELFRYLYRAQWTRILVGLLTLASAITLWLKEELK
jgi:hypothetical protein